MIRPFYLLLIISLLTGCSNLSPSQSTPPPALAEGASRCPEPRPESADQVICPMNYQPVCGLRTDDQARIPYGNACSACAHPEIGAYTDGTCP